MLREEKNDRPKVIRDDTMAESRDSNESQRKAAADMSIVVSVT